MRTSQPPKHQEKRVQEVLLLADVLAPARAEYVLNRNRQAEVRRGQLSFLHLRESRQTREELLVNLAFRLFCKPCVEALSYRFKFEKLKMRPAQTRSGLLQHSKRPQGIVRNRPSFNKENWGKPVANKMQGSSGRTALTARASAPAVPVANEFYRNLDRLSAELDELEAYRSSIVITDDFFEVN